MTTTDKIYLAAPFFSDAERSYNESLVAALENAGWVVFYPYRDGIRMAELVSSGSDLRDLACQIHALDTARISECRLVIAVLDGRSPDEGVCVEIGFANAIARPIMGLKTDGRYCFSWGMNPMITGSLTEIFDCQASLIMRLRDYLTPGNLPD